MKRAIEGARALVLLLLAMLLMNCNSSPTCNILGNNGAPASRRVPAAGCPVGGGGGNGGGGGGGGGGGSCNSQLSPVSAMFGVDSTGKIEEWEIATTGDLNLTCNTGTASVGGQTVTAAGKFVYVFDPLTPQVFEFSMSTGGKGALTPVAGQPFTAFNAPGTFDSLDFAVADPLGRFLVIPSFSTSTIHVLLISSTGALSEAVNSPFAVSFPNMVAIDPTGSFVFAPDPVDGDLFSFTVNSAGTLTPSTVPFVVPPTPPIWVAVAQNGKFLFSANDLDIGTFSINASTGSLSVAGVSIDTSSFGAAPNMLAIDSTGGFLYLLFQGQVGILGFSINSGTGALTQLQSTTFANSGGAVIDQMLADPIQANLFVTSGGGIFNIIINQTNGDLTVPPLTVTSSTPLTSGEISISSVP